MLSKTIYIGLNTGPEPLNIGRKPRRRTRPFKITPTQWCEKGCPHVRPHPAKFRGVYLYFRTPGEKNSILPVPTGQPSPGI